MKKFIIKSVLFFILGSCLLILIGEPLTKVNPNKLFVKQYDESLENNQKYDIYFFGSSRSFGTYNPRIFREKLGVSSFNFGSDSQRVSTTEFYVLETVKKHKPKLLIIDAYYQTLLSPPINQTDIISYQYAAYDAFEFSWHKVTHMVKNYPFKEVPAIFFKSIRNHKGWKSLTTNHIDAQKTHFLKEEINGYRGWQYTVQKSDSYLPLISSKVLKTGSHELNDEQKNNLKSLCAKLKELNVPVLFVTAPSLKDLKTKNHPNFTFALKIFLKQYGFDYLDLNTKVEEIELTPKDFRDPGHLNNIGGNKVSTYFAKWLNRNYNVGELKIQEINVNSYIKSGSFNLKKQKTKLQLTDKVVSSGFDFIKTSANEMTFIMEVTSNDIESLKDYVIMLHAVPKKSNMKFLSKKTIEKGKHFEIWDFKPKITKIQGKNYLIKRIETKIKELEYINLGVYSAKGYNGALFGKTKLDFNKLKTKKFLEETTFKNKVSINEKFIDGFKLESFEVIEVNKERNEYKLIFILNDDVTREVVENYSVTVRFVPTEKEKEKNGIVKKELFWDFKPMLLEKNGNKYMERIIVTELEKLKELRFALYHREGYQGKILSKVITLNNVSLTVK